MSKYLSVIGYIRCLTDVPYNAPSSGSPHYITLDDMNFPFDFFYTYNSEAKRFLWNYICWRISLVQKLTAHPL